MNKEKEDKQVERLNHLYENLQMLEYITPIVNNEEQQHQIDIKKKLLSEWIAEMINND